MEDTIKIELLTPLTGNFTSRELERQWEEGEYEYDVYEGLPLEGADLSQYESEIKEAIEKYNAIGNEEGEPCNLMDYFDGSVAIKEKVISAVPSVKQKDGVLYGCTTLELTTFLEQPETEELYEYVTGQYSDGWGEGFEQQKIQVGDGEIYVHFWQSDDYEIQISDPDYQQKETEMRRPKMQLVGQDGNVFSILARANKLLQANGQGQEAKEMIARVQKSENYYQALYIISEYVETELSEDFQKATKPPKKRGKNADEVRFCHTIKDMGRKNSRNR